MQAVTTFLKSKISTEGSFCFYSLTLVVMRIFIFIFIGSSIPSKRKLANVEVKAVEKHMMRFIQTCKVPGKQDCERCIQAEPEALKERTWTGVKNYVRNRITTLKRNGGM